MADYRQRRLAGNPDELGRLFLERANNGDVDGVLALYESGAALTTPDGRVVTGIKALRDVYEHLFEGNPMFDGDVHAAITVGDIALTPTRFFTTTTGTDGRPVRQPAATAEMARRQPDGSWLCAIDQPNVGQPLQLRRLCVYPN